MEKISIVNEDNKVIGAETKAYALENNLIRQIVRIYITNNKNQIYLQKRSATKKIAPNTWDQSVGGHVNEGEDYFAAAKRELSEELGVEGLKLKEITNYYFEEELNGKTIKSFDVIFEAEFTDEFNLNKDEISEGKWFGIEELKKLLTTSKELFAPGLIDSFPKYLKATHKIL